MRHIYKKGAKSSKNCGQKGESSKTAPKPLLEDTDGDFVTDDLVNQLRFESSDAELPQLDDETLWDDVFDVTTDDNADGGDHAPASSD